MTTGWVRGKDRGGGLREKGGGGEDQVVGCYALVARLNHNVLNLLPNNKNVFPKLESKPVSNNHMFHAL